MGRNILRSAAVMAACLCTMAAAQGAPFLTGTLPTLRITTSGGDRTTGLPPTASSNTASCGSNSGKCGSTSPGGGDFAYIQMTGFELTVPGNTLLSITRPAGVADSIRRRGNSTAGSSIGGPTKIPMRIKFANRVGLFGREPARSWVLLANWYDNTNALNAIAFELGRRLGLHGTPTVQFVDLYVNNTYRGIYQLTEQIQVNPGRVDIDERTGWLVEIDYHQPDRTECNTWFHNDAACLGFFIKSPEDLSANDYDFVRTDVNNLVTAVRNTGSTAWRDMIDFQSFAKYLLVQQFMDNFDFNSKVEGGGFGGGANQFGLPGSNFIYKDHCNTRIYAGPLWDFDLSVGVPAPSTGFQPPGGNTCTWPSHCYNVTNAEMRPRNDFYRRMWDDPAFQKTVKDLWAANQAQFNSIPEFIDRIAAHIGPRIAANCASASYSGGGGMSGGGCNSQYTLQTYNNEISQLKSWWTGRMTNVTQQIDRLTGNVTHNQTAEGKCEVTTNMRLAVSRNPEEGGTVTVKIGDGATQTNPPTQTIAINNTRVTVTATPTAGWIFTGWTGVTANMDPSATTLEWGISSDRNLVANFAREGQGCNGHTLTVNVSPSGAGTVTVNPNQTCFTNNAQVTLTVSSNSGYTFVNWTGDISTSTPTSTSITVSMTRARTITANFSGSGNGGGGCDNNLVYSGNFPGSSLAPDWSIMNTGGTTGGAATAVVANNRVTINPITAGQQNYHPQLVQQGLLLTTGAHTLTFTAQTVSGTRQTQVVVQRGSDPWTPYVEQTIELTASPQSFSVPFTMTATDNNVQLAFNLGAGLGSGGVIISDVCLTSGTQTSIGQCGPAARKAAIRTRAIIRADARGLSAMLPANHGYTSYKLIDLQGREIRSGKIAAGVTDLRFNRVRAGVVFLRLEGKGGVTTLRTTVAR